MHQSALKVPVDRESAAFLAGMREAEAEFGAPDDCRETWGFSRADRRAKHDKLATDEGRSTTKSKYTDAFKSYFPHLKTSQIPAATGISSKAMREVLRREGGLSFGSSSQGRERSMGICQTLQLSGERQNYPYRGQGHIRKRAGSSSN